MSQRMQIIALSLPGYPDPGIPVAASRAGGLGVLDLEFEADARLALERLSTLARLGGAQRGVKLDLSRSAFYSGRDDAV